MMKKMCVVMLVMCGVMQGTESAAERLERGAAGMKPTDTRAELTFLYNPPSGSYNNGRYETSTESTSESCEQPLMPPVPTHSFQVANLLRDDEGQQVTSEELIDVISDTSDMFREKELNVGGEIRLVEVKTEPEDILVKAFQPTPPEIIAIKAVVQEVTPVVPQLTAPKILGIFAEVEPSKGDPSPQSFQTQIDDDEAKWKEEDRKWNERNGKELIGESKEFINEEWEEEENYQVTESRVKSSLDKNRPSIDVPWRSTRQDRVVETNSKLQFETPPPGEPYTIHTLGLSEGVFVFTYLGQFLSIIQPNDFPVELLRDALWNKMSIFNLILQSLTVEAGFITCLVVGVILALVVPILVFFHGCARACSGPKKHQGDAGSCGSSDSTRQRLNWRRKTFVFVLIIIVALLGAGVTAMFVTNEELSVAIKNTPRILNTALDDASAYLRNTQRQLVFVITRSLELAVRAIASDLDAIERLLGVPIQNEITAETGVDVALASLMDVASATSSIGSKIETLQREGLKTREVSNLARERLADLRQQVDSLRRQCGNQDRPLCDTIDSNGLDITFRIDPLLSDMRLSQLKSLRDEKIEELADRVKTHFQSIPQQIGADTSDDRTAMKQELQRQKAQLDGSVWPLENLSRDLRHKVEDAREVAKILEDSLDDVEQWRWIGKLGMCLLVLFIWFLLLMAIVCSCCDAEGTARSLLISSVAVICLSSAILWSVALAALMVGGHGEVFVCRPLYDEPEYRSLTQLLDDPGILYQRGGGFFSNLLYRNQSLDVPVRTVLQECEQGRAAYPAFRLDRVFSIEATAGHQAWVSLHNQLRRFEGEVNLTRVQLLEPELQRKLNNLGQATSLNITSHRLQFSKLVTGKDLNSFARQLDSVANQIKDLSTASRIETLASRTRRLLATNIQPLETKREEIIYQLTALEVLLSPLQRQVNQTLSHLRTIQYFINNQGTNIAQRKTREFVIRLANYLDQYRQFVLEGVMGNVASCKPVWNMFHAVRLQLCRHLMDPLNGFWFATVWCLLLFVAATPVCLKLVHCYTLRKECLLASSSGTSTTSNGNWNTPGTVTANGGW